MISEKGHEEKLKEMKKQVKNDIIKLFAAILVLGCSFFGALNKIGMIQILFVGMLVIAVVFGFYLAKDLIYDYKNYKDESSKMY